MQALPLGGQAEVAENSFQLDKVDRAEHDEPGGQPIGLVELAIEAST